jgi:hypothetical protein
MGSDVVESMKDPQGQPKTNEQSLVKFVENAGIPIKYSKSVMNYLGTGDQKVLSKLSTIPSFKKETLEAMRGRFISLQDNPNEMVEKTPREKIEAILTVDQNKKEEYASIAQETDTPRPIDSSINTAVSAPSEPEKETILYTSEQITNSVASFNNKKYSPEDNDEL